jgi:uncharacterized protein (TIGR03083 family)
MTAIDADLEGLNPYDLFDRECERVHGFFTAIGDDVWTRPSRCRGWTVRDMLGHLRADEDYFQAGLDGKVGDFFTAMGEKGATDLDSGNRIGIETYADVPVPALVDEWWRMNSETRRRFRERDGGDVDTAVGAYPARLQAFHLAQEYATHADDIGVPVTGEEEPARTAWRAAMNRFALMETKAGARAWPCDGGTGYEVEGVEGVLPDREFVEAVGGRLPDDFPIDEKARAALNATP